MGAGSGGGFGNTRGSRANSKIHKGRQDKHIPGTNNFKQQKANGKNPSILTENPNKLLREGAGKGISRGSTKEVVDYGRTIGRYYDRETGKFEFSGKEYIPDFIIPKLQLCIEVKLLRDGRKSKVIEEISADITAYAKQYERQLFVVYDLGVIQNEEEFRRDIENAGNVKLIIVKH